MAPVPLSARSLPAQLTRTRRFTLGSPDRFTVAPDGASVLFLRSRAGDDPVHCLWALDVASGEERLLADPVRLPGCGRAAGIEAYATDRAAELVAFSLVGGLWTVGTAAGAAGTDGDRAHRLPATGPVTDPRPDPTGRRVAYVSAGALRVIGVDGAGDRVLAAPDGPHVGYGTAPHTGLTSPADPRGFWWAPDGERLLVARTDSARVGRWHIADPADPGKPPRTVHCSAAGTPNAEVSLWLTGLDGSRTEVRAGAGVTDQRMYDAHWRERFLGHPDEHPQRYDAASLLRAAPNLTRPLLLIHGLDDVKSHPANTLRLSSELLAAERPHEVLLLPGIGHRAMGSAVTDSLLRHQVNFLRRHLGSVPA